MLENIKSAFYLRLLFSFPNEKKKLKIAMYSKSLKNKLNINLINYKLYSGKYIVYENNGRGKEYKIDNDQLLFEGEYVNKKRDGMGIEYNEEESKKFEGEYKNGKRNGKGKEYFLGIITFAGEYINGERNGK